MAITSFTCPHCKKKQDSVGVTSFCTQALTLGTDDWTNLTVGDTLYLYCLECGENLPETIRKKFKKAGVIS